jgi:2-dehydro-3-deoxyphosphogluconate aldolase/(4S)-4-hydroxy-2-oxoglutarate aldolase
MLYLRRLEAFSMDKAFKTISEIGLVPVIKIEDAAKAVPLGKALVAGGIPVAEVTFRTAAAEDAIKAMTAECSDLLVGAGTVINVDLAKKAIAAGAKFIVSPGFNPSVVDYCLDKGVPILPGANNASFIEAGLERGLDTFKFFPAEASGGVAMIDALAGPFGNVKFVPTGGIDASNVGDYAKRNAVLAIGGTWMVKADLVSAGKWDEISALCSAAVTAVNGFSFAHLGMNHADEKAARDTANILAALGLPLKDGNSSIFAGSAFEVMKSPFRGKLGHIAIKCYNLERALAYLSRFGFSGVQETAKMEKGYLKVIYLDKELAGFAVHLVRD